MMSACLTDWMSEEKEELCSKLDEVVESPLTSGDWSTIQCAYS